MFVLDAWWVMSDVMHDSGAQSIAMNNNSNCQNNLTTRSIFSGSGAFYCVTQCSSADEVSWMDSHPIWDESWTSCEMIEISRIDTNGPCVDIVVNCFFQDQEWTFSLNQFGIFSIWFLHLLYCAIYLYQKPIFIISLTTLISIISPSPWM